MAQDRENSSGIYQNAGRQLCDRWTERLRAKRGLLKLHAPGIIALAVLLVGILWWMVGGESILQPQVGGEAAGGSAAWAAEAIEETVLPVLRVVFRVGLWIWLLGAVFSALGKSYKLLRRSAGF